MFVDKRFAEVIKSKSRLYKKAANLGCKAASADMQRLGYIKAEHENATPDSVKIDNGAMQVIEALPLPESTKRRLAAPFRKHAQEVLDSL